MSLPYEGPGKYKRRGSYQEIIAKNICLTYIGFCHQARHTFCYFCSASNLLTNNVIIKKPLN